MVKDDRRRWCNWFERHAVLSGWLGAIGAIAAICAAWLLAQAQHLRTQRLGVNAQISLIGNVASQFDPLVQQYIKLALEKDSKVANYYLRQMDDPRVERMIDFKAMPISHWPSIEVYHAFNEYYFSSIMLMETSADEDTSINLQDRIATYERNFEALQKALDAFRR